MHSRRHTIRTRLLEQLLVGWTAGGMRTVDDDDGDDGEEHHHHCCCKHLLAGWMGRSRQRLRTTHHPHPRLRATARRVDYECAQTTHHLHLAPRALLVGWTAGGMRTVDDDDSDDSEEHHHHCCCEHLLAGWMGRYRQPLCTITTRTQLLKQLLVGWTADGTLTVDDDNGELSTISSAPTRSLNVRYDCYC